MPNLGQTVVQFPISGSDQQSQIPVGVYLRVVQQVSSASVQVVYHPGGGMTGSLLLAPRNVNRVRFTLLNSGSLNMAFAHGNTFNPNVPPTVNSHWDNIIVGTSLQQGNQNVVQSMAFEGPMPCYTGPLYIGWFGSGPSAGPAQS